MEKKKYVKPSFEVYELKNQTRLLAGSGGGDRNPYGPPVPGDWNWGF